MLKAVNNALTSYIKLRYYVILNSNEPIKIAHLQKLTSQSMLNGAHLYRIGKQSQLFRSAKEQQI